MANDTKIREAAKKLNPIDDIMFKKMAESLPFCQEMLQVFLQDKKLVVLENRVQYEITNLQGRSVRLDLKCILGTGEHVTVEVQKADDDDHQRRVRYNTSLVTANITDPGKKFKEVPNVISVYISKSDIFKKKKTVYHVERVIKETGDVLDNGLYEVYVNAKIDDGSEAAELMRVFKDGNTYSEKFPEASARKHIFRETPEGAEIMNDELRKIFAEELTEGIAKAAAKAEARGEARGVLKSLASLVKDGILNITDAAKRAGVSVEEMSKAVTML